jgi:hypothetical protein
MWLSANEQSASARSRISPEVPYVLLEAIPLRPHRGHGGFNLAQHQVQGRVQLGADLARQQGPNLPEGGVQTGNGLEGGGHNYSSRGGRLSSSAIRRRRFMIWPSSSFGSALTLRRARRVSKVRRKRSGVLRDRDTAASSVPQRQAAAGQPGGRLDLVESRAHRLRQA